MAETLALLAACLLASLHSVHVLQMSRYQIPVYRQWLSRSRDLVLRRFVLTGAVTAAVRWYFPMLLSLFVSGAQVRQRIAGWIVLVCFLLAAAFFAWRDSQLPMRKPLVITRRVQRLLLALAGVVLVVTLALRLIYAPLEYLAYAAVPYAVLAAAMVMNPVEERINAGFYHQARAKIDARPDLITIGITGSRGKTLTKYILSGLLTGSYEVLITPASYNTAMGISRVINDQLEDRHQVFIAEMGAQHVGDIRHLVQLVRPKYGVITSVGPEHLDTFGSLANIVNTKYELIEGLPEDGVAFFASDNWYLDRMFATCTAEKYDAAVEQPGAHSMVATDVHTDRDGTRFVLRRSDGASVPCRTRLLGRTNVLNIALAAAVANRLGVSMEDIARRVSRLATFEKRLQLIEGDPIVIDDRLNATSAAAAEALAVLGDFPGRRVIVTPGLPAPEGREEEVNYAFGAQMRGCVDAVILVGEKRALKPVIRGVTSTGLPRANVRVVPDMESAEALAAEIAGKGDTILYEGEA